MEYKEKLVALKEAIDKIYTEPWQNRLWSGAVDYPALDRLRSIGTSLKELAESAIDDKINNRDYGQD